MMLRALPLLLCLFVAAPAGAASGLEQARAKAQSARTEARTLRTRQQGLRDELNGVAARIEALKAQRQGKLTAGGELESALRRSQELSGELTGLAQSVSGADGEVERAHLALHGALSQELTRLRASWDATTDRTERARLVEQMRSVRGEREAVRAALPASQVPALDGAARGDDPEDLLAQADALRDSQDKVRQRLQALKARITEVREERDLDRRMNDFLGEESMFDDQDRRLRLRSMGNQGLQVAPTQRGGRLPVVIPTDSMESPDYASDPNQGPNVGGGNPTVGGPSLSATASDRRPQVDPVRAQALAAGGLEDLSSLEQEAARLESLASELDGRAGSLERRAKTLAP
ncbi:TetR family transcriptional regulator [Corallococcus exiguus]|uniref:TetR family transcriptional regulator n=1 Tax=Corallococcus TaxID=83461 RepID=UPI000EC37788|nr:MULTISPECIES: TetR family transcriptional regulator [Corallococcus]NNB91552.1 TetR family transcriptional regulator [Corallococcus exiguus]NNB99657.1 TetR family transcriptional regulator [Corallococcus exiguus]NNC08514.1 TetR family transcriptional regulator [Corallococcus exiguus]NPC52497.1 TetR family transcriptional regulator [Corallococcus exiguus]RKH80905.1 TetR family transcriptional regulator [Corallococcus sp. AB032C]